AGNLPALSGVAPFHGVCLAVAVVALRQPRPRSAGGTNGEELTPLPGRCAAARGAIPRSPSSVAARAIPAADALQLRRVDARSSTSVVAVVALRQPRRVQRRDGSNVPIGLREALAPLNAALLVAARPLHPP